MTHECKETGIWNVENYRQKQRSARDQQEMASFTLLSRSDSAGVHAKLLLLIKCYMVCLIVSVASLLLYFFAVFAVVTEIRSRQRNHDFSSADQSRLEVAVGIFLALLAVGLVKQPVSWFGIIRHRISWVYGIIVLDIIFLILSATSLVTFFHFSAISNIMIILLDLIFALFTAYGLRRLPENRPEFIELQESMSKSISSKTSRTSRNKSWWNWCVISLWETPVHYFSIITN